MSRIKSLSNGIVVDYENKQLKEENYYMQLYITAELQVDLRKEAKGFVADLQDIDISELQYDDMEKFDSKEFIYSQSVLLKFG